ncbi:von Willebrand factor type A domain protein [Rosistilla carotiformis]|uniref:von Willebrand factor type A domain protein n=2 Tax=Rosistilla carotiformis TaxID=2528017 RepID=A0A518JTQ2_9BACT|nr:von Willebrand factor type A domain protein [Rosistilla carotiformis]
MPLQRFPDRTRTGAILVMFLFMLAALIALGAMALDLSLVEAARTDMRIVSDLSSKAASVEYTQTGSISLAKSRAKNLAIQNTVIGAKDFRLDDADIAAGNSQRQTNNKFQFSEDATPINSFRVVARLGGGSVNPGLQSLFPGVRNGEATDLSQMATATEINLDIVLVLDRSASMAFDLSGVDWVYPNRQSFDYAYFQAPQPRSRWDSLENAIDVFFDEMGQKEKKEHIALVSYSAPESQYSAVYRRTFTATEVTTNANFTNDYAVVQNAVRAIGNREIIGGTAISSGIDRARTLIRNSPNASFSEKVIILMTDGQWNTGYNPVQAAVYAKHERITIHTVSFGAGASFSVMQDVANTTGGIAFQAASDQELQAAFREIARSIGLSLTE